MARWQPPDKVGPNELIGRRLFEEPMLHGAGGQPNYSGIPMHHFEETRGPQTSVDRLGATGLNRKVRNYLMPRARAAGVTFAKPKKFDGWATVRAKHLKTQLENYELDVHASPITEPECKENIYHAHVDRPCKVSSYVMALHLRQIFLDKGQVERAVNKSSVSRWQIVLRRGYLVIITYCSNLLFSLRRHLWRRIDQ